MYRINTIELAFIETLCSLFFVRPLCIYITVCLVLFTRRPINEMSLKINRLKCAHTRAYVNVCYVQLKEADCPMGTIEFYQAHALKIEYRLPAGEINRTFFSFVSSCSSSYFMLNIHSVSFSLSSILLSVGLFANIP